jgi:hypothetical protein
MAELVTGWISYERNEHRQPKGLDQEDIWAMFCAHELVEDHANLGLDFVLSVLATKLDNDVIPILAAGPLEEVLAYHGPVIIDRIEDEARRSPDFCHLLGGVWQNRMPDEIWQRVRRAAPNRW